MISTFAYFSDPEPQGAEYGYLDEHAAGTSWAAPQVAGIVALMLKMNPALTPAEVKYILEATATDITASPASVGYDDYTGFGLVNAQKAVTMAMKQALPADWNGDGNVETLDAVQYTVDYTNADPMTDLNLDTTHTTDDMAIFLNSYTGN
ncbi:MAG: hypothetical protein Kow0022_12360 [Phycisphaerales bacterium]